MTTLWPSRPRTAREYVDLCTQRCETLLRMGDYERVIAEAPVETQESCPSRTSVPRVLCPDRPGRLRQGRAPCSARSSVPAMKPAAIPGLVREIRLRHAGGRAVLASAGPRTCGGGLPADGGGRGDLSWPLGQGPPCDHGWIQRSLVAGWEEAGLQSGGAWLQWRGDLRSRHEGNRSADRPRQGPEVVARWQVHRLRSRLPVPARLGSSLPPNARTSIVRWQTKKSGS